MIGFIVKQFRRFYLPDLFFNVVFTLRITPAAADAEERAAELFR